MCVQADDINRSIAEIAKHIERIKHNHATILTSFQNQSMFQLKSAMSAIPAVRREDDPQSTIHYYYTFYIRNRLCYNIFGCLIVISQLECMECQYYDAILSLSLSVYCHIQHAVTTTRD